MIGSNPQTDFKKNEQIKKCWQQGIYLSKSNILCNLILCFEISSYCVTKVGLECVLVLLLLPKCHHP